MDNCSRPAQLTLLRASGFFVLILLAGLTASAAQAVELQVLDLLRAVQPAANTTAIGTRTGFVLAGIPVAGSAETPRTGDQVTALVALASFTGKSPARQWLVRLQLAATPAANASADDGSDVQYTNTGEKFTFRSRQTKMTLETLGPVEANTAADKRMPIQRGEIAAATDFLGLDLCRTVEVISRITAAPKDNPLNLSSGSTPYPAEEIKLQQPRAAAIGLKTEDIRSFSGSLPALMQFLRVVENTPDLKAILSEVLDKPSVLDVLAHPTEGSLHFQFGGGGPTDGQEIFWPQGPRQDFRILAVTLYSFRKPVLTVIFYVTTPHAPLLNSAGIVGLVAWSPKKPDKVIGVRVLSATAGPTAP